MAPAGLFPAHPLWPELPAEVAIVVWDELHPPHAQPEPTKGGKSGPGPGGDLLVSPALPARQHRVPSGIGDGALGTPHCTPQSPTALSQFPLVDPRIVFCDTGRLSCQILWGFPPRAGSVGTCWPTFGEPAHAFLWHCRTVSPEEGEQPPLPWVCTAPPCPCQGQVLHSEPPNNIPLLDPDHFLILEIPAVSESGTRGFGPEGGQNC